MRKRRSKSKGSDSYESELARRIREQKVLDKFIAGNGYCMVCGNSDPEQLVEHHIAGRKHSDITVTLCANHHQKPSRKQRSLPADWLDENAPPKRRRSFMLIGLADLLQLIANYLREQEKEGDLK